MTIGSPERGLEFAELTAYPAENLLADPENVTYNALSLKRNPIDTYFNPRVSPQSYHEVRLFAVMAKLMLVQGAYSLVADACPSRDRPGTLDCTHASAHPVFLPCADAPGNC